MGEMLQEPFYAGTFSHRLDDKNRVTVPAKWRFSGDENDAYLAWPHPDGHIVLYPPTKVRELREVIRKIPESNPAGQTILRRIFGAAHQLGPDTQGRLKLPDELLKHAGIADEVVLVGLGDRINIQSKANFAKEQEKKVNLLELMKEAGL
jgi:MraZ protein